MASTIKDVARRAGVSVTTVSRVLTGKAGGHMREATRQRVLQAARRLDYSPDPRARSLRGLKSGLVGMIIPEGLNPFYHELVHAVMEVCYEEGYGLLSCTSERDEERELRYIKLLQKQKVDGIIISTEHLSAGAIEDLKQQDVPIVLIDEDVPGANVPAVYANNYQGACLATQYLVDLGHYAIAFIKGPSGALSCRERYRGYRDTLRRNGVLDNPMLVKSADITYQSGYAVTKELLAANPDEFTALFCSNDFMALGAMGAMREQGKRIPDDYSVVGFDNVYVCAMSCPELTSVAQPIEKIAARAFSAVRDWHSVNPGRMGTGVHQYLDTVLIQRASCGPPRTTTSIR